MTRPPDIKLCPLLGLVLTFCNVINFVLAEEPGKTFKIFDNFSQKVAKAPWLFK